MCCLWLRLNPKDRIQNLLSKLLNRTNTIYRKPCCLLERKLRIWHHPAETIIEVGLHSSLCCLSSESKCLQRQAQKSEQATVKKSKYYELFEASCRQAVQTLHLQTLGNYSISFLTVFLNYMICCHVKDLTLPLAV